MSRVENINKLLCALHTGTPDIEACALISEDGLMIASVLPQHFDEARVAGMSATLLSLGTRAAEELSRGTLQEVLVRGDDGYAVMLGAGGGTLLLVLATKTAKLGLLFLDMRRVVAELKRLL